MMQIKEFDIILDVKTDKVKYRDPVSDRELKNIEVIKDDYKAKGGKPTALAVGVSALEDNPLEYNKETQYLVNDGYEILKDKIVKKYKVEDIPKPIEPEPSERDLLNDRISVLEQKMVAFEKTRGD